MGSLYLERGRSVRRSWPRSCRTQSRNWRGRFDGQLHDWIYTSEECGPVLLAVVPSERFRPGCRIYSVKRIDHGNRIYEARHAS